MKKFFSLVALVATIFTTSTLSTSAVTNIVQTIYIQLTFMTQGPPLTNTSTTLITDTIVYSPINTANIISLLGVAMNTNTFTNTFSTQATLVRVDHLDLFTNFTTIEIRDGSNAPVNVTRFFAGTHVTDNIQRTSLNLTNGIPSGPGVSILFVNFTNAPLFNISGNVTNAPPFITNAPPFNLAANFAISGLATTSFFGLAADGGQVPVEELYGINMAGTGIFTNGEPAVITGQVSIRGSSVEIQ